MGILEQKGPPFWFKLSKSAQNLRLGVFLGAEHESEVGFVI